MKLEGIPFQTVDFARIAATTHPGAPGTATWRTLEVGNVRARIVEYSAGYVADHWCARGHVLFVLEGELITELKDGRTTTLTAGQSYVVADDDGQHRS
jgi:quercetin dioxygenase-like cupin family protein